MTPCYSVQFFVFHNSEAWKRMKDKRARSSSVYIWASVFGFDTSYLSPDCVVVSSVIELIEVLIRAVF